MSNDDDSPDNGEVSHFNDPVVSALIAYRESKEDTRPDQEDRAGAEAISSIINTLELQQKQLEEQETRLAEQQSTYEQKTVELKRRETDVLNQEQMLDARKVGIEPEIGRQAGELAVQSISSFCTGLVQIYNSSATDAAKRAAASGLLKHAGVEREESVRLLLGITQDTDTYHELVSLGEEIGARTDEMTELIALTEAAKISRREIEQKEQELENRITDAEELEEETREKEQQLIERESNIETERMELVENVGKTRSLYSLLQKHAKDVMETMFPEFKEYRARIDDIQRSYKVQSVALFLTKNYLEKLDPEPASDCIRSALSDERKKKLESIIKKSGRKDVVMFGHDKDLGEYFIAPVYLKGLPIANFCMIGLPGKKGEVTEDYRQQLREVADSVKRTVLADYATIHMLSQKGMLDYVRERLEMLENRLRDTVKA
ncbi:hypothetical protein ACFL3V_04025 [Nanoarchaeota archaeon]